MGKINSVAIVVPTLNAETHLPICIPALLNQELTPRILVVDSSSDDDTVRIAHEYGVEIMSINRYEFNHGSTRERARKYMNTDIVVFMTQDTYPQNTQMLEKLVDPIRKGEASVCYGRQIPRKGSDMFEAFPREFNYPNQSQLRSLKDIAKYGVYTYFCSNSCAAYKNSALDEIRGFRSVIIGEDTLAAAMLLMNGHKIAYVADAVVEHSHHYSLIDEFKRYFDTGYYRKQYHYLLNMGGKDSERGKEFFVKFVKIVIRQQPWSLPYLFLNFFLRWSGYELGKRSLNKPIWFKKIMSKQSFFWESNAYNEKSPDS
jgi:rhamnosyltransferase